jgi:hypothetical protein
MYDLDSWLRSGIVGVMLSLPASRELFWKIVRGDNMTTTNQNRGERTLFLPVAIDNSQKIRTVSGCISDGIPALVKPFPEESEEKLVATLMREIREKHAIEIDLEPNLDRCSGDNVFPDHANSECRIFAIGASHMTKMVGGLAECGINVINLAKPGWALDEKTVLDLKNTLKKNNPGPADIFVIDPLSNATFCGTDSDGNFADPEKIGDFWHVRGELNVRPKAYLKLQMQKLTPILNAFPETKIVVMSPMPRYMHRKCCDSTDHITNFSENGFQTEISEELEKVDDLLTAWLQTAQVPSLLVNYRSGTDDPEADVLELSVGGTCIWQAADPVHAIPQLYQKLAEAICSSLDDLDVPAISGQAKRPRLESLVVRSVPKVFSQKKPASAPQSWSAGHLPANISRGRARGRGAAPRGARGQRGWYRGNGFWRGGGGRGGRSWPRYRGR